MKNIAIMTWYHYYNYGTALQATALYKVIEKLGYKADVIQYIPNGKVVALKDFKILEYYIKKVENKVSNKNNKRFLDEERKIAFGKFLKENITLTSECKTESDLFHLNNLYDTFVCGSDQIWAPSVFNPKYFLDFVQDTNRMVAYAPSIGLSEIKDKYTLYRMKYCINRFKYLSIREEQGAKLIKEICSKYAINVLDPTLLLSTDEWNSMASENNNEDSYILCYFLGNNKQTWNHVRKLSEKTKIPIKVIPIFGEDLRRGFEVINGVGPAEFLGLVKKASFVCTDSFHGTVFSIIYERPFYTYERFSNKDNNSQNSRIYNILKLTGLENRIIKNKHIMDENPLVCKFQKAKRKIEIEKVKSINYLEESLYKSTAFINKMPLYKITNTCCGCGACAVICSQEAITVKRNEDGFLEAYVNKNKCIQCGLCQKVCPYNGERSKEINRDKDSLFMVRSKSIGVQNTSSSGGAAYEISKLLCTQGYDVVGCTYDKIKREAIHKIVHAGQTEKLNIFQGSKYIQSNTSESFNNIIYNSEQAVVFGTPCQISAMDRLLRLKNKRDKFVLVDLICHGVPTQNLWEKYIKEGSIKFGYGLVPEVEFRYKRMGWRNMHIYIHGNGKTYVCLDKKDLFYRFFLLGHSFMPACYECAYRTASAADIRLGDYWGPRYKKVKDGVSMVITMSDIGKQILNQLNDETMIELQKMDCSEYWSVQYPENPIKPVFYDELIKDLANESISLEKLANKYCSKFESEVKIRKLYSIIRSIYKKMI